MAVTCLMSVDSQHKMQQPCCVTMSITQCTSTYVLFSTGKAYTVCWCITGRCQVSTLHTSVLATQCVRRGCLTGHCNQQDAARSIRNLVWYFYVCAAGACIKRSAHAMVVPMGWPQWSKKVPCNTRSRRCCSAIGATRLPQTTANQSIAWGCNAVTCQHKGSSRNAPTQYHCVHAKCIDMQRAYRRKTRVRLL